MQPIWKQFREKLLRLITLKNLLKLNNILNQKLVQYVSCAMMKSHEKKSNEPELDVVKYWNIFFDLRLKKWVGFKKYFNKLPEPYDLKIPCTVLEE